MSERSGEIADRGGAISLPCHVSEVPGHDVDGHPLYRVTAARPFPVYLVQLILPGRNPMIVGAFSSRDAAEAYCNPKICSLDYIISEVEVDGTLRGYDD